MDLELTGRVAVVTGASRGIGLAITRTLLEEGANVVAASRSGSDELARLTDAHGEALCHVAVDLATEGGPAEAVAAAAAVFGGLDLLVNNAGGPPPGDTVPHGGFASRSDAQWLAMLDFNLLSAVRAIRAALPLLLENPRGGAIVNVSSVVARLPASYNIDYGAAKAALTNISKALSDELAPQGVRVNCVSPGPVRTPWWTDAGGAADIIAAQAGVDRDTLLDAVAPEMMALSTGRLVDPQEVADAVALLCSPRSASTTGADVVVDAGMLKAV